MTGPDGRRWLVVESRLRRALDETVRPDRSLRAAVTALSARYRAASPAGAPRLTGRDEARAYVAYRMPATFHATGAAMWAVSVADPGFAPRSLLDVGAGPGTAAWATLATWPTIEQVTLVDREGPMLELGRRLARQSALGPLADANWVSAEIVSWRGQPADLVVAGYVLGELPAADRAELIDRLWDLAGGVLVLVEPGTPDGFERIRLARDRLIDAGASVVAPCPHDRECPIVAPDWCHFSVRLARSRLHRQAKAVRLPYEDERYSYVALGRSAPDRSGRVIARPRRRKGAIDLRLCTDAGIVERTVSRREGSAYRAARRLDWGSTAPPELGDGTGGP